MSLIKKTIQETSGSRVWRQFAQNRLAVFALSVVGLFILVAVYAPFFASSKPIALKYSGVWYFPLFRYLFFTGFYTKGIDLFFNILIFTLPLFILALLVLRSRRTIQIGVCTSLVVLQYVFFLGLYYFPLKDPASDPELTKEEQVALKTMKGAPRDWNFELRYMNDYEKLNLILREQQRKAQNESLKQYLRGYSTLQKQRWLDQAVREKKAELMRQGKTIPARAQLEALVLEQTSSELLEGIDTPPTLWAQEMLRENSRIQDLKAQLEKHPGDKNTQALLETLVQRRQWIENQEKLITFLWMPLIRPYHWEDDAGGQQALNANVSWWELTRINRKDLVAALIFGTRISLVVGLASVAVAYLIGIPVGAYAGYYGGTTDIVVSRLLEIWESMPVFFMLLMVVAMTQTKSVFLVIGVIGIFGWTGFSRYIRGEFFKQRNLPYVEACHAQGFSDSRIMFSHLLPNAIPPLLTLMPFAVMGAITTEAGLSFLGLGEEGSCSWGVLMDEGRSAFPGEAYLLWPPAILLTILLVAIALVGDALRDALDPKLSH